MMAFFLTPQGYVVRLAGGLVLALLGWLILPIKPEVTPGDGEVAASSMEQERRTEAASDHEKHAEDEEKGEEEPQRFRLSYDEEEGFWYVAPEGSRAVSFTDIVPGPREAVPNGYLSPEEIRKVLLQTLQAWRLKLSNEDRQGLLALRLGGKPLFRTSDL